MNHIHAGGVSPEVEREWVERSLSTLRRLSGQQVRGWYSPAYSQTHNTLDLVAAEGCDYVCDWVNDDMPYQVETKAGPIHAMPHAYEISDLQIFHFYKYKPAQFVEQVMDHFDLLYREAATSGGRIVALSLQTLDQRGPTSNRSRRGGAGSHATPRRRMVCNRVRNSRLLESAAIGARPKNLGRCAAIQAGLRGPAPGHEAP